MNPSSGLPEPLRQLEQLLGEAREAGVRNADAMALASVDEHGRPSVRMVLLRGLDARGLVFFTNYGSPKARDLDATGQAAAVFYWEPLGRQVRVSGSVERISNDESESYFASRPRGHRLAAWASRQSQPLPGTQALLDEVAALERRFPGEVPLPPFWGGYRLAADTVEHWTSKANRLHERVLYSRTTGEGWSEQLLQP